MLAMTTRPTRSRRFRLEVGEGKAADIADLWARADRDAMTRTRARYFGYVLQTGGLLPFLDIYENRHIPPAARPSLPWTGVGDLEFLGIGHLSRRMPARVSIGERQRAAAARALAHGPKIVLADEPTASLDPTSAERVMELFVRLAAELAITLVVVSHDRTLVERMRLRPIECAVADGMTLIRDQQ